MYQSDSDSKDSDDGIRFKTDSIRNKYLNEDEKERHARHRSGSHDRMDGDSHSRRHRSRKRINDKGDSQQKILGEIKEKEERNAKQILEPILPSIGPQLPPHLTREEASIGPQLPPYLAKPQASTEEETSIGPQLPPHLQHKQENTEEKTPVSSIGPQIPPHLRKKLMEESSVTTPTNEDSDDETYGPLPAGVSSSSRAHLALEERALQLKMDQLDSTRNNQTPVREEWMLELPEVKAANLGLGPRQFRSKAGPDMSDRSSWTDTPAKKAKKNEEKVDLGKEAELMEIQRRNREQEKMAKKHKKKNKESLLEMHQNKLKNEKKDQCGPSERKPFNRETDLQVNRFDEAQKKAVLKKAQLLDNRFSTGQSKYL